MTTRNHRPKGPRLQDLHADTLGFGLPETWIKLDDVEKSQLQAIIEQMRNVEVDN
jgi:hypothetical protein